MRRSLLVLILLLVAGVPALATPWWEAYEGDVYPETLPGWTRVHGSIPAERSLQDGSLVIDSRQSLLIYDYYEMVFDHPVDPGPGETFVMRWRLKVDATTYYDQEIAVTSDAAAPDEFYSAAFGFRADAVVSVFEHTSAPFAAGVFHDFELRSPNMRTYELYVDGAPAMAGLFTEVFGPPRVSWGDGGYGSSSLAEWDYVRFGVTPEPSAFLTALAGGLLYARRTRDRSGCT